MRTSLPAGTEVTLKLPGGGSCGPPWERDPELVLEDVRKGYVSAERRDYGVAIDIERLAVLEHGTRALRAKMGAAGDPA